MLRKKIKSQIIWRLWKTITDYRLITDQRSLPSQTCQIVSFLIIYCNNEIYFNFSASLHFRKNSAVFPKDFFFISETFYASFQFRNLIQELSTYKHLINIVLFLFWLLFWSWKEFIFIFIFLYIFTRKVRRYQRGKWRYQRGK